MAKIKQDEILGIFVSGNRILCTDFVLDWNEIVQHDIILNSEI